MSEKKIKIIIGISWLATAAIFLSYYTLSGYDNVLLYFHNYEAVFYLFFLLLAIFTLYVWVFRLIKNSLIDINKKIVIVASLALCLLLAWQPLLNSTDFHQYLLQARILVHHGENPYLVPPNNFVSDWEFCQSICTGMWQQVTNMYGPWWFYFTLIPAVLANGFFLANYLLLKLMLVAVFLASAWLIYKILDQRKAQLKKLGLYLFALSPLLIFEVAADGHNDIVLVFLIILHFYFLYKNRKIAALLVLTGACLIKFITLPMLGIYFIYLYKIGGKNKNVKMAGLGLLVIMIFMLSFWPIWQGSATLNGLLFQSELKNIYQYSPGMIFSLLISKLIGHSDYSWLAKTITTFLYGFTFLALVIHLLRSDKLKEKYLDISLWSILLFILLMPVINRPWYLIWVLPFLLIKGRFNWFLVFSGLAIAAKILSTTYILLILLFLLIAYYGYRSKNLSEFKENIFRLN